MRPVLSLWLEALFRGAWESSSLFARAMKYMVKAVLPRLPHFGYGPHGVLEQAMAEAKKAPRKRKDTGRTSAQGQKRARPARKTDARPWGIWAAAAILAVAALRLA